MKKIVYIILTYFLVSTQILAEVTLLCYTTNYNVRDFQTGKVDYSETQPSRWTLVIEFFDDKNIIVRPKGSSETGGKCGPGLGTFTESEIKYVCKFNSPNEKGEIFNLNRFSGLYESETFIANRTSWFLQTTGTCELSRKKI